MATHEKSESQDSYCRVCGAKFTAQDSYCGSCGTRRVASIVPTPIPSAQSVNPVSRSHESGPSCSETIAEASKRALTQIDEDLLSGRITEAQAAWRKSQEPKAYYSPADSAPVGSARYTDIPGTWGLGPHSPTSAIGVFLANAARYRLHFDAVEFDDIIHWNLGEMISNSPENTLGRLASYENMAAERWSSFDRDEIRNAILTMQAGFPRTGDSRRKSRQLEIDAQRITYLKAYALCVNRMALLCGTTNTDKPVRLALDPWSDPSPRSK